jgi:hypothetical protein
MATLSAINNEPVSGAQPAKFGVPALAYLPAATSACIASRTMGPFSGIQTHGRLEQSVKCVLVWLAVSRTPYRRPHSIRGPGGRARLAFEFLFPRSTWSEAAGPFGHSTKCACIWRPASWTLQPQCVHPARREWTPQCQPHSIRGPGVRAWLLGSALAGPVLGRCRQLRAYC